MTRYYRVLKETPLLYEGAIISGNPDRYYSPLSAQWNKLTGKAPIEQEELEINPDTYQEVFPGLPLENGQYRTFYVDKAEALKAVNDGFQVK